MARLVVAEGVGDALALLGVEHHAGVVVEQAVVLVEGAGVLGEGVEQAAQRRQRLAVERVGVGGGDHVGAGGVDLGVDGEGGLVERPSRPRRPRPSWSTRRRSEARIVLKCMPERVDPEVVGVLGVAGGDVAGHALVEAELAEEPERGGEALLAVQALVLDGRAARERERLGGGVSGDGHAGNATEPPCRRRR